MGGGARARTHAMAWTPPPHATLPASAQLPVLPGRVLPSTPLLSRRRFYLSLHSDDAMTETDAWRALEADLPAVSLAELPRADEDDPEGRVPSLANIVAKWSQGRAQPLVGMLAAVGRIVHYGRPEEAHECPFKFSFTLVDSSRQLEVVVWNTAACVMYRYMRRMLPGDLIAVGRCRVRPYNGVKEASVNRGDPVYVLAAGDRPRVALPALPPLRVVDLGALYSKASGGSRFSFAGIIARIGPVMLEPAAVRLGYSPAAPQYGEGIAGSFVGAAESDAGVLAARRPLGADAARGDVGPFCEYRWMRLRPALGRTELAVKVYLNSRPAFFLRFVRRATVRGARAPREMAAGISRCVRARGAAARSTQDDRGRSRAPHKPGTRHERGRRRRCPAARVVRDIHRVLGRHPGRPAGPDGGQCAPAGVGREECAWPPPRGARALALLLQGVVRL